MATDNDFITYDDSQEEAPPTTWPAFGLPLIEDLPDPFPLDKLQDREFMNIAQRLVGEAIRCNQNRDAIDLIHRMRQVEHFRNSNPSLYQFYWNLIILLKFVSFVSRKQKDAASILGGGLVLALRSNVSVRDNFRDYLDLYEGNIGPDREVRREFVYSLENNKEKIGSEPIVLGNDNSATPTVQNWLKDYNIAQPLTTVRTKFNQINYLNTSENVRKLSKADKKVLEQIIGIYDWLLFPPVFLDFNPQELDAAESDLGFKYLTADKFVLPKEVMEPAEEPEQAGVTAALTAESQPVKSPPQIPTPGGQAGAKKVSMNEIVGRGEQVGKQESVVRNYELGVGTESRQAANSRQETSGNNGQGVSIKNLESRIQNTEAVVNKPQQAVAKPAQPAVPKEELIIRTGPGISMLPGVNLKSVLPNYNKPLTAPLINSDTLAAKMKGAQESSIKNQVLRSGAQDARTEDKQAVIDQKLKDLEVRVKGENKQ